jgi:hypothetical protein
MCGVHMHSSAQQLLQDPSRAMSQRTVGADWGAVMCQGFNQLFCGQLPCLCAACTQHAEPSPLLSSVDGAVAVALPVGGASPACSGQGCTCILYNASCQACKVLVECMVDSCMQGSGLTYCILTSDGWRVEQMQLACTSSSCSACSVQDAAQDDPSE